jgi:hypothetical protein
VEKEVPFRGSLLWLFDLRSVFEPREMVSCELEYGTSKPWELCNSATCKECLHFMNPVVHLSVVNGLLFRVVVPALLHGFRIANAFSQIPSILLHFRGPRQ